MDAVGTRLSGGTNLAGSKEGISSGDNIFKKVAVWVQGLYSKAKLDSSRSVQGFDSKSYSVAMGIEKNIDNKTKLGLGYAYTNTDIDGFLRKTDVDTHTAIVYGEYKPSQWYVNAIATYGWSDYNEKKNVAGNIVKGSYDVEAFGLQVMTGYDFDVNGYTLTPEAGLRYVNINQDAYTDKLGQSVSSNKSDILTGVVGAKAEKKFALENGTSLTPQLKLAATYDLFNDDESSVVTMANGASYAVNGKALKRFGMEVGAGVKVMDNMDENLELYVGYEGRFRKDYYDHTGLVNLRYKF